MRKVIYTAIINNYDTLKTPTIHTKGWDYICFTDDPSLKSNIWQIVVVKKEQDSIKLARRIKICYFDLVGDYDISIWIDGSIQIHCDLNHFCDRHFNQQRVNLAISCHPFNKNIREEAATCIEMRKDCDDIINHQMSIYKRAGYSFDNGLVATGLIIRNKAEQIKDFCRIWYGEVEKYSNRDQLSFNYVLELDNINCSFFPFSVISNRKYFSISSHNKHISNPCKSTLLSLSAKTRLTYNLLLEKIMQKQSVTFARYGDGEWNAIFGKNGANCDKHKYFPSLGKALRNVLRSKPKYFLGMQNLAMQVAGDKITDFVNTNDIQPIEDWCDADILHKASIKGRLYSFFSVINHASCVLLVAPEYLKGMDKYFKYSIMIEVPALNCWLQHKRIKQKISLSIQQYQKKHDYIVVLFAAGMMSNVLIDSLHNTNKKAVAFLDVGSIFDPFVGKKTRSYHKVLDIQKGKPFTMINGVIVKD